MFTRLTKWLATFIAAWFSLKLLQSKKSEAFTEDVFYETENGRVIRPTHFAGRTMDLTLFAVTRALDVVVGELWTQRKERRSIAGKWSSVIPISPIYASLIECTDRKIDIKTDRSRNLRLFLCINHVGMDLYSRPVAPRVQQMDQVSSSRGPTASPRSSPNALRRDQVRSRDGPGIFAPRYVQRLWLAIRSR